MSALMIFDFDGVLNPIPYTEEWVGPERDSAKLSDFEIMSPKNWRTIEIPMDDTTHFKYDSTANVSFNDFGVKRTYLIRWSSELIENINRLVETTNVEFRWLSTWREQCQSVLAPALGLNPEWKSIPWEHRRSDYAQIGKLTAVEDLLTAGEDRPFVWVDDVITELFENFTSAEHTDEEKEMIARYSPVLHESTVDRLVIQPDMKFGVSRAQWDAIEKFVHTHQ